MARVKELNKRIVAFMGELIVLSVTLTFLNDTNIESNIV